MADRFTVVIDTSRLTHPNYETINWVFDSETEKGYALIMPGTAHDLARRLNGGEVTESHFGSGWQTIRGFRTA